MQYHDVVVRSAVLSHYITTPCMHALTTVHARTVQCYMIGPIRYTSDIHAGYACCVVWLDVALPYGVRIPIRITHTHLSLYLCLYTGMPICYCYAHRYVYDMGTMRVCPPLMLVVLFVISTSTTVHLLSRCIAHLLPDTVSWHILLTRVHTHIQCVTVLVLASTTTIGRRYPYLYGYSHYYLTICMYTHIQLDKNKSEVTHALCTCHLCY